MKAPEAPQPPKKEPVEVSAPAAKATTAPTRSSKIPRIALSLGVGAAWWNAPETALSTAIGIEAQWPRVSLSIEGYYDHAWAVPDVRGARADRSGGAIVACAFQHGSKRFFFRGCGLGTFTRISLEWPLRDAKDGTMIDLGVRLGLGAWLSPSVAVELRGDVAVVLMRPYVYVHHDQVWHVAPLTGALRLAFVGAFDVF